MRSYKLYQLGMGDENHYHRFVGLDTLEREGMKVESNRYEKVYEGNMADEDTLETLFRKFNVNRPADFTGWSMSVSDVVVITEDGISKAYYCDSYGFVEVPEFLKEEKFEPIDTFGENSIEYKKLALAASMLTLLSPEGKKYRVGETYFDYGQDWKWTTILANSKWGDYQVLNPMEQRKILLAKSISEIETVVNAVFTSKYCPDKGTIRFSSH